MVKITPVTLIESI